MSAPAPGAEPGWIVQRYVLAEFAGLATDRVASDLRAALPADADARVQEARAALDVRPGPGGWPTPVALAFDALLNEDPAHHLHLVLRLKDAFEALVRYLATVAVADVLAQEDPSPGLLAHLSKELREPAMGSWLNSTRLAIKALEERARTRGTPMFVAELAELRRRALGKEPQDFVEFRNLFSHSALPPDEELAASFHRMLPVCLGLYRAAAPVLERYPLVAVGEGRIWYGRGTEPDEREGTLAGAAPEDVVLLSPTGGAQLVLPPLLAWRTCHPASDTQACGADKFLFYNKLGKRAIHYQDYKQGHYCADAGAFPSFVERLPLHEWASYLRWSPFASLIQDGAAGVVERGDVLKRIDDWLDKQDHGALLVAAGPGMGKTSLFASLCLRGWPDTDLVPLFVSLNRCDPDKLLRQLVDGLVQLFGSPVDSASADELVDQLDERLARASDLLRGAGRRLVIVIDGLDAGLPDDPRAPVRETLLRWLPERLPSRVFLLFGGRPTQGVTRYFDALAFPAERIDLAPLPWWAVRQIVAEGGNEYRVTDAFVDRVFELSRGHPMYARMVADELAHGRLAIGDLRALPASLVKLLDNTVARLAGADPAAARLLHLLAHAREPLDHRHLSKALGDGEVGRALDRCQEVLVAEQNARGETTWRLFHDLLHERVRAHAEATGQSTDARARLLVAVGGDPTLARCVAERALPPREAPVGPLVDAASGLSTTAQMVDEWLTIPLEDAAELLLALVEHGSPAAVAAVARRLCRFPKNEAQPLRGLLAQLTGRAVDGAHVPAATVAVETCLGLADPALLADLPDLADPIAQTLAAFTNHADKGVRAAGIFGLIRLVTPNFELYERIQRTLAGEALWWRIPRLERVEPLAILLLGTFLEHTDARGSSRVGASLAGVARDLANRVVGLDVFAWVASSVAARIVNDMPDDYAVVNLAELKAFKRELREDPAFAALLARLVTFVDPDGGSTEELRAVLLAIVEILPRHPSTMLNLPFEHPIVARAIRGDEGALELAYEIWQRTRDTGGIIGQDFVYLLRLVAMGRRIHGGAELGTIWRDRAVEATEHFYFERGARFRGADGHVYAPGSLIAAFPFLFGYGDAGRTLLDRVIDDAWTRPEDPASPRHLQRDALLLRVLEIESVEYGTWDPVARDVAFHGLERVLTRHADHVVRSANDTYGWPRIGAILARMRTYYPEQVDTLLARIDPAAAREARAWMGKARVGDEVGALLGVRAERLAATTLGAPREHGALRASWAAFLADMVRPVSVEATLRAMTRRLIVELRQVAA